MVRITYDPLADAMYIYVRDARVVRTEHPDDNVAIDYDADSRVVGVEILGPGHPDVRSLAVEVIERPRTAVTREK